MELSKAVLGWIGTGVMGKSMCGHLLKKGYNLSVFNRSRTKTEDLLKLGAKYMTPLEMAEHCDIIFLMVGYPKDVEEIVLNQDTGILRKMKKNSFLIDHTTSSPSLAQEIFKVGTELGVNCLDAPVSGGDIGAREARLVVMTGGDKTSFEQIKPIIESYSAKISLMGPAGMGQHTKMANQVIISSTMIGMVEGLLYAYKAGLDQNDVISLLSEGAAGSFSLKVYGPRIMKRDFEPGFYVEHFVKDMEIALNESKRMNLNLRGLELALEFYKIMIEDGLGKKGTQGLYLCLEKLNKINI
jgi:3-hydroxyisobutyrate dehydrogenase